MKKTLRNKIIILAILVGLGITYIPDHKYKETIIHEIDYDDEYLRAFKYSLGTVYIGNYASIYALSEKIGEQDILVIDYRGTTDANMQVLESYEVKDIDIINEILEILCYYEKTDPSAWDRTIESMRNEWELHNYSYMFKHNIGRTRDVDLNNEDEEKYASVILTKLLRN